MKLLLLLIIIIVVLVLYGIYNYTEKDRSGGLRIENFPNELTITKLGIHEIELTFTNHTTEDINDYHIITNTTKSSGPYIEALSDEFDSIVGSNGGTQIETMRIIDVRFPEGNEMYYVLDLYLYANDDFEKKYSLPVKIISSSQSFPLFNDTEDNESVVFAQFNTNQIELFEGEEKTIDFRMECKKNCTPDNPFENLRVIPYLENHRGQILEISNYIEDESLDKVDEKTGIASMSIRAVESEGEYIKYRLQLVLKNNDVQMDTRIIDVIIKPN